MLSLGLRDLTPALGALLGALLLAAACSTSAEGDGYSGYAKPGTAGAAGKSGTGGSAGGSYPVYDAASELPPEKELESSYEFPAATNRFVWVANPLSGRVAYINGATLEVRTTQAGNGPTWLAAVPDPNVDTAIVINVSSSNATLLRADPNGNINTVDLPIAQGNDSWAIDPGARWAISWTNFLHAKPAPPATEGYQDITVLRVVQGEESSTRLSVGYRPVAFSFSTDGTKAYAVTQDGISVIDLAAEGGPVAVKLVAISDDLEDPGSRDVSVTPDGTYALVRRDNSEKLTVVALEDGTRTEVMLPAPVTDLDLSPDGSHAVAVVRDTNQVAVLPLPDIAANPDAFKTIVAEDAIIGSVAMAAEAKIGMLYSNATQQQRIVRLSYAAANPTVETLKLHAPVLGVTLARDASGAIILHSSIVADPDAGTSGSSVPGAFSVLRMNPDLPARLQTTKAAPMAVAISTTGNHAVVAERDDATHVYGAYLVRMPTQQVDRYLLGSPPISAGVLADANRAFVAQKHPEGRVTFMDLDTGQARTLTGFELGARVVDGSQGN